MIALDLAAEDEHLKLQRTATVTVDPILNYLEAHEFAAILDDCANQCSVLSIGSYQHNPDVSSHSVRIN